MSVKPQVANQLVPPALTSATVPAGIARRNRLCPCGEPATMRLEHFQLEVCPVCHQKSVRFGLFPKRKKRVKARAK